MESGAWRMGMQPLRISASLALCGKKMVSHKDTKNHKVNLASFRPCLPTGRLAVRILLVIACG